MLKSINGATLRKMVISGANFVEQNHKSIDALNVFPVPDGDTGTNMSMTLKSTVNEVSNCKVNTLEELCQAISKGALKGARGNSGVILSQILKGMTNILGKCENNTITTKQFAKALKEGCDIAYKAVTKPTEGTILTVIRIVADSANECSKKVSDFEEFFNQILQDGENILQQTPEMLPVLKKAGVVDSGGRGLIVFLTGLYKGLTDDDSVDYSFEDSTQRDELGMPVNEYANLEDLGDIQFGYCTEFMIIQIFPKTTLSDIDKLRERLCAIGDSVLCIGDLSLVKVHVHTNEPSKALGFALELGELFNVKIENMREQFRNLKGEGALAQKQELKPFGMVAVAPGEGISNVFTDLGIDNIISGGQTMNPSADDIATAVNKVPAETVFVFPNNKNIILAAEQAKGLTDKKIEVIPSRSVPEGIASALAFNPEGTFEDNKEAMNSALNTVKSGAVTYAVRSTKVDNFDLTEGEIIGLDNKTILSKGSDIKSATLDLIDKMINDDIVNITLFSGKDVKEDDSNLIVDALKQKYPDKEISLLQGGQPVYYYLISLE